MEENKRKKAPNLVLAIICVTLIVFFAVLFVVCVVNYNRAGEKTAEPTKKNTVANTVVDDDVDEEEEDDNGYITPTIKYGNHDYTVAGHRLEYPSFSKLDDSFYAMATNNELEKVYDEAIKVYENGKANGIGHVDKFEYKDYLNGDILSLVLEAAYSETDVAYSTFYVYNINVATGKKVEEKEIADYLGISEEKLKEEVWNTIEKRLQEIMDEHKGHITNEQEQTKEFFDNGEYQVLLGENKKLVVIAKFAVPAGRGYIFESVTAE